MQIKETMQRYGFTPTSLAKKMGVYASTVIRLTEGNPTVDKLDELARWIGCSRWEFFQDEIRAAGFDIVKQSEQQQPAPQPADGQQGQGSAADELPFTGGGDGGKRQEAERTGGGQPTATVQQAIICPHCKRAIAITVNGI